MTTRNAPYRHTDGSNCWTVDCSLGNVTAEYFEGRNALHAEILAARKLVLPTSSFSRIPSAEEFNEAAEAGRIYRQRHPEYPYSIYKYQKTTQYTSDWDDVTMQARGIIINDETGEIVALPFRKFFNYAENKTPEDLMQGPIVVSEKLDGSLGVLYPAPDGRLEISTSGGFQSQQAAEATAIYREKYEGNWEPNPELTYLHEIIYPTNRIVVNYGEERDIYLLGAVNKQTGRSVSLKDIPEWNGPRAQVHEFSSMGDVAAAPDRANREGYIIHFTDTDTRVKVKHDEYVKMHRVATGLDEKAVWEMYANSKTELAEWRGQVEEEFLPFIDSKIAELDTKKESLFTRAEALLATVPADADRRTAASIITSYREEDRAAQGIVRDLAFRNLSGSGDLRTDIPGRMEQAINTWLKPFGRGTSMWAEDKPEEG